MKLVSNHKLFEDFFDEVEVDVVDDQVMIEEEPYRESYDYICYIKTITPENAVAGKLYLDNTFSMFNNADISPVKIVKVDYKTGLDDYTNKPIDDKFCYYYVFFIKGKMSFKEFMFLIKFIKSSKFGAKLMNERPYIPEIAVLKYLGEGLNNYYDFLIHCDLEDVEDKLDKMENYVYYYAVYVPQKSYDKITEMHQLLNIANILLKPEDIHKLFDSINVSDEDYLELLELINGSESKISNLEFISNVDWQANMNDSDEYQELMKQNYKPDLNGRRDMFLSLKADNYTGIFSTPVFYLFNDNMQDKLGTCFDLLDNTFELFSQIGLDCLDVIKTHKMTGKLYFMRSKTSHIQLVIFFDEKCVAYFNEYGIAYRPFFIIDYYQIVKTDCKRIEAIVNFLSKITGMQTDELLNKMYRDRNIYEPYLRKIAKYFKNDEDYFE